MALQSVDEEGKPISLASTDPRPKPSRQRDAPQDKPLDGPTTKTEIQRALCVLYNLSHKLLHDSERYMASDFVEEADGLVELMQQHSMLRIVMRIAAPLAAVGAIFEKVEGTLTRWRERGKAAKQAKQQATETARNGVVTVETVGGLSATEIAKRPFGR